jgi:D-alanyl-D-alanine carboxypeptidase (penicillin-binding protein 5/6)
MILGALMSLLLMLGMQLPLLNQPSTSTTSLSTLSALAPTPIAWPSVGSAALVIPALGVQREWHNAVVPIASLTKLMTAYVVLQKLPLSIGETGPCLTVTPADVTYYDTINAQGQSSAAVATGEVLCESTLLDGLLVHSASNFATLLAQMAWGSTPNFVARMNTDALALGLTDTHYVDTSGVDPGSVSTALDQGLLTSILMKSALVRTIVAQSSVTLPVAGTLGSFTPFIGVDNVVGVKSGRTDAAGGCDVMAMTFVLNGQVQLAYAVILGARGGDLLGPAGDEALALERSVLTSEKSIDLKAGTVVGTVGWGSRRSDVILEAPLALEWFSALDAANVSVTIDPERSAVVPGQVVGWLDVDEGGNYRVALTVARQVSPASLWERLR